MNCARVICLEMYIYCTFMNLLCISIKELFHVSVIVICMNRKLHCVRQLFM